MTAAAESFNQVRAAFMRRASAPNVTPFALKLAYLLAFKYMNRESGIARPAQETLARDLNVTSRTIRTLLDILEPLGLTIIPGHGPNRSSSYCIDPDKATRAPSNRKPASASNRKPASASEPNTGKSAHDNRKLDDTNTGSQLPPNLTKRTKKRTKKRERALSSSDGAVGKGSKRLAAEGSNPDATPAPLAHMATEEYALAFLRGAANRERHWPLKGVRIDSGDGFEAAKPARLPMREEWRENYQRAWNKLSRADQEILADYVSESGIGTKALAEPQAELVVAAADDGFARFWAVYPRQIEQEDARAAFAKAVKGGADIEAMIARARVYALERAAAIARGDDPKWTLYPATWLKKKKWNDPPPPGAVIDEDGAIVAIEQEEDAAGSEDTFEARYAAFQQRIGVRPW